MLKDMTLNKNLRKYKVDPKLVINYLHINCVRHYGIYKAILTANSQYLLKDGVWMSILNASLNVCVINWCELFGSNASQSHWSNHSFIENLSEQVLPKLDLPYDKWLVVHDDIKTYRDKISAHMEINKWDTLINHLDLGMQVLYKSFDFLHHDSVVDLDLEEKFSESFDEMSRIINASLI